MRRLPSTDASLLRHAALQPQDLLGPSPASLGELLRQRRRGGERTHFVPRALGTATTGGCETLARRWLLEEPSHLRQELGLIRLDHEAVVSLGLADLRTERVLAVARIPGHQPAPQR